MYLENINSPQDVKKLTYEQLHILSDEIRVALLQKLSKHGGHIGPNLGLVELTIALHYVFHSPVDKIVYDVSHQSYVHKMLTGRQAAFINEMKYDDVSGYSNPFESEHDFFTIGHTSTSISLASGLAKARDLKNELGNVIALIGDGSLSGGEAFEGLNYVSEIGTNMIVIVNDNEMSIAENHGGLYGNLRMLRESKGTCDCNFFKAMGFAYYYIEDGHDIPTLISTFTKVKDIDHPIVIHVHTIKGKGYEAAEKDKEAWHWGMPFDLTTGASMYPDSDQGYDAITAQFLLDKMKKDQRVVAITSGTPAVFGFHKEQREMAGKQFVDVGIAEEQAIALASGLSKNGAKPVYGVYSTFLQRTYDQLSQDLCINKNPATILVFAASIHAMSDVTHLGIYDIAMIGNIPNLVYLAPTCVEEYLAMVEWSIEQNEYPVAIRVPSAFTHKQTTFDTNYADINRFKRMKKGKEVAIIAAGSFYDLGEKIVSKLATNNIQSSLLNPRFISGIDKKMLEELKQDHRLVITLEDGMLEGGFGEKVAAYYSTSTMFVKSYGFKKGFYDRFDASELMKENGIDEQRIVEDVKEILHL